MKLAALVVLGVGAAAVMACGGGGGGGGGLCNPTLTSQVTIASTGFTPSAVCVLPGGRITFVNGDSVQHHIESSDSGCSTQINLDISAGQSATTQPLTTAPVICTFHDSANASAAFQGTVAVSDAQVTGPGY